jgi:hypothetical protein
MFWRLFKWVSTLVFLAIVVAAFMRTPSIDAPVAPGRSPAPPVAKKFNL